ncbi:hypothetical protein RFI_09696, partial [Reticulomyxa filosa]
LRDMTSIGQVEPLRSKSPDAIEALERKRSGTNDSGTGQEYNKTALTNKSVRNKEREKEKEREVPQSNTAPRYHDGTDDDEDHHDNTTRYNAALQSGKAYRSAAESDNRNMYSNGKIQNGMLKSQEINNFNNATGERAVSNAVKNNKGTLTFTERVPQTNSNTESSSEYMHSGKAGLHLL